MIVDRGGVTITAGSAQLLLAMKLRASRPGRDGDDIAVLVRACGVRTLSEAQAVLDEIYLADMPWSSALGEIEIRLATRTIVLPAVESD
ncbi:MAG: hypothetical protein ACSLFB_07425 [Acidimicrobiales bacterium]